MAPKQLTPALSDLAALRRRIDHWREARTVQEPLPEELWGEAVSVARRQGLFKVARSLRLSYQGLSGRLQQAAEEELRPNTVGSGNFVEIDGALWSSATESQVTVELAAPDGSKLTVHLSRSAGPTVLDLVDAFWRRGA